MGTNFSVASVVRLAQECSSADAFGTAVLQALQRSVGFEAAFFQFAPARPFPQMVTAGIDPAELRRCAPHWSQYRLDTEPVRHVALRGAGVAVDGEVLGESGLRRTQYFRDLAVPHGGGGHALVAYLSFCGQPVGGLILGRSRGHRFLEGERSLLAETLPALSVAVAAHSRGPGAALHDLSPRERDVLDFLQLGLTNAQIANATGTSVNTVRNHVASILRKLGAASRAEAVAVSMGWSPRP